LKEKELEFVWQIGRVVQGDGGDRVIEFRDPAACRRCKSGRGCGAGQFARLFGRGRPLRLRAPGVDALPLGAMVRIGIDSRWLLLAAAAGYLVPVLAFIAGAVAAGPMLGQGDGAALIGGLIATAAAWHAIRRLAPGLLRPAVRIGELLESAGSRNHLEHEAGADGACNQEF
jgi:positive regulator of sigma E activity